MYTFYKDELVMSVNKTNSDEALRFADRMILRTQDGYWKPCSVDCKSFEWTHIIPVDEIVYKKEQANNENNRVSGAHNNRITSTQC